MNLPEEGEWTLDLANPKTDLGQIDEVSTTFSPVPVSFLGEISDDQLGDDTEFDPFGCKTTDWENTLTDDYGAFPFGGAGSLEASAEVSRPQTPHGELFDSGTIPCPASAASTASPNLSASQPKAVSELVENQIIQSRTSDQEIIPKQTQSNSPQAPLLQTTDSHRGPSGLSPPLGSSIGASDADFLRCLPPSPFPSVFPFNQVGYAQTFKQHAPLRLSLPSSAPPSRRSKPRPKDGLTLRVQRLSGTLLANPLDAVCSLSPYQPTIELSLNRRYRTNRKAHMKSEKGPARKTTLGWQDKIKDMTLSIKREGKNIEVWTATFQALQNGIMIKQSHSKFPSLLIPYDSLTLACLVHTKAKETEREAKERIQVMAFVFEVVRMVHAKKELTQLERDTTLQSMPRPPSLSLPVQQDGVEVEGGSITLILACAKETSQLQRCFERVLFYAALYLAKACPSLPFPAWAGKVQPLSPQRDQPLSPQRDQPLSPQTDPPPDPPLPSAARCSAQVVLQRLKKQGVPEKVLNKIRSTQQSEDDTAPLLLFCTQLFLLQEPAVSFECLDCFVKDWEKSVR